jgi:hypothetical protein
MSKIELLDLLQQDVEDIKGLINYKEFGLSEEKMKTQARGIILNLQEHLEELVEN